MHVIAYRRWIFVCIACLLAGAACADTRTWKGVNTNWHDTANWSGGVVPGDTDDVIITNSTFKPTMPPGTYPLSGSYASFSVSNGAIVNCLGDTGAVNAASGGTVAKPHGAGVTINCQGALIDGTLTADTNGFTLLTGSYGGPGWGGSPYGSGGTYGGRGAWNTTNSYGSLKQPTALGSCNYWPGSSGCPGGGAIKLNVSGTLTVNGTITASSGVGYYYNGGSGGSIWLICNTFQGRGTIKANGANSAIAGAGSGGGGRVAIEYTSSTFSGAVSVAGGGPLNPGQPGTLYDPKLFPNAVANITITNSYQYYFPDTASDYSWGLTLTSGAAVYFHDFTNGLLTFTNLLVTAGSALRFDVNTNSSNGVSGNNNLFFSNSIALAGGSSLYVAFDCRGASITSAAVAGGSVCDFSLCTNVFPALSGVIVTNANSLLKFDAKQRLPALVSITMGTNTVLQVPPDTYSLAGDFNIPSGAVLYARGNTNVINEASGGITGRPHGSGVHLIVPGNAVIDGTISATSSVGVTDGFGFLGYLYGYPGPGGGGVASLGDNPVWGDGGGHGGQSGGVRWRAYGRVDRPTSLGSGDYAYSPGGGAVRLTVSNALALNGRITVNGGPYVYYSGGSGGSVWITCASIRGTGIITAAGQAGGGAYGYGGGGGRVAIESSLPFTGTVFLAGAYGNYGTGKTGTYFQCVSLWPGTCASQGYSGKSLATLFSVSSNDLRIARTVTHWGQGLIWSDSSTDTGGTISKPNIATYTVSGLIPRQSYYVSTNNMAMAGLWPTNPAPDGTLTFSVALDGTAKTIQVMPPRGTIFTVY